MRWLDVALTILGALAVLLFAWAALILFLVAAGPAQ